MAKMTAFFRLGLILFITLILAGIYGYGLKETAPFGFLKNPLVQQERFSFSEQDFLQQKYAATLKRKISESLGQFVGEKAVHVAVSAQLSLTESTMKEDGAETTLHSIGQDIYSISVVALLDSTHDKNQIYQPFSKEQLKHYEDIVKTIVGFNPDRGDRVLVLNQPFHAQKVFHLKQGICFLFIVTLFVFLWMLLAMLWEKNPSQQQAQKIPLLAKVREICLKSPRQAGDVLSRWIDNQKLEQACIVILAIGSEHAKFVFRYFKRAEIRAVVKRLRMLGKIPSKTVGHALCDFMREMANPLGLVGNDRQAQEFLNYIPGGQDVYSEILAAGSYQTLWDKFNATDSEELMRFLKGQSSETVAFILVHLHEEKATDLLEKMSEEMRSPVLIHLDHLPLMKEAIATRMMGKVARDFYQFSKKKTAEMEKVSDLIKSLSKNNRPRSKITVWQDVIALPVKQKMTLLSYVDLTVLAAALAISPKEEQKLFADVLSLAQWQAVKEKMTHATQGEQAKTIMIKTAQEVLG